MPEKLVCRICGDDVERPATGRPPRYCGEACRRYAENERARLGRHLSWLERERVRALMRRAAAVADRKQFRVDQADADVAVLDAEIVSTRERMVS